MPRRAGRSDGGPARRWHDARRVVLGRIVGAFGVRGWVRVAPFSERRDMLLGYRHWQIGRDRDWREVRLVDGRGQGSVIVARLDGVAEREQAQALRGLDVALPREALPPLEDGEYYWSDLVGLEVHTRCGLRLGTVERLIETGANDVLVVAGERERLIPYVPGDVVLEIDVEQGRMEVDWDPEF